MRLKKHVIVEHALFVLNRLLTEATATVCDTKIITLGMKFCVRDVSHDVTADTTSEEVTPFDTSVTKFLHYLQ